MNYSVDINNELKETKSKLLRHSLVFAVILTITLISDVLLVGLANEEYAVNLIVAMVISILFIWYSVFFFVNIYQDINAKYRYYKGYESGLKSKDEIEFINKDTAPEFINGLVVYKVHARFIDGLSKEEKTIYTLNENLPFVKGDKLSITTYQRILVEAEKHS